MKRILSIVAASLMIIACSGKTQKYTIAGTAPAEVNDTEITLKIGNEDVASTTVKDGSFSFTGKIAEPSAASLIVGNDDDAYQIFIIVEGGNITVDLEDNKIGGSSLNEAYQAFSDKMGEISREYYATIDAARVDTSLEEGQLEAIAEGAYGKYETAQSEIVTNLFNENKNNIVGALALASIYDENEFITLYEQAGEVVKNNSDIKAMKELYDNLASTAEGKMFKDFTIEKGNADGSPVKLSDYVGKGKWVLVDFWASWCAPCRKEIPNIAEVYKQFKGDKFEVLGIAVWDKLDDTKKALTELPITWPVIYDAQSIPTDIYGINGIPQIILFGPDGTIVKRDLRGAEIGKKVAEVLAE